MTTKEIDEIIDEVIANNTAIEAFREFGVQMRNKLPPLREGDTVMVQGHSHLREKIGKVLYEIPVEGPTRYKVVFSNGDHRYFDRGYLELLSR